MVSIGIHCAGPGKCWWARPKALDVERNGPVQAAWRWTQQDLLSRVGGERQEDPLVCGLSQGVTTLPGPWGDHKDTAAPA